MPSRPDIRDIASNVRDAFAECEREQLLDILTFVLKEYVVEGPPPTLLHQAETLADLKGMSFAQVISALQTRFEFAELGLFAVDGETVSVRVGGVMQPLLVSRQAAPEPVRAPPPQAPGAQFVEAPVVQRPNPVTAQRIADDRPPPAPERTAPPPSRGLSLRGRPAGGDAPPVASTPPPAPAAPTSPTAAAASASAPAAPDKPKDSGDDASARFSLLELD